MQHKLNNSSVNEITSFIKLNRTLKEYTLDDQIAARDFIKIFAEKYCVISLVPLDRIGSKNDGGYLLSDFAINPTIISGGIAENYDFENILHQTEVA